MPLNTDPNAWSDEKYERVVTEMRERAGDNGLHTIPADQLAAAVARAKAGGSGDVGR